LRLILVYTKAYPLHVVLGELFELRPVSATEGLQRLLPVWREAVRALGGRNARLDEARPEPGDDFERCIPNVNKLSSEHFRFQETNCSF
jgi:hypothetical protein